MLRQEDISGVLDCVAVILKFKNCAVVFFHIPMEITRKLKQKMSLLFNAC
jgi:hypothetical protein